MTRPLLVFSGRSNPAFSKSVCDSLGIPQGAIETTQFSDGEISVEIGDNVRGGDVFVIQSTCAPSNDRLMELLIIIDALKRSSAGRITAALPYFGYARQDRKVKPRVPITAKLVADMITAAGADRVLTLDLHAGQIMGFFNIPVDNLFALPVLQPFVQERYGTSDLTIVAPDVGGVERARLFATRLDNAPIAVIDKRRSGPNRVASMNVVGDVAGQTCLIVDDMIDTGGTLIKAADVLLEKGAKRVVACCVHAVLSADARRRVNESRIDELVVTDTIPHDVPSQKDKITVVSVAPLFAEAIRRIHSDDSISSLFR
ncbi:MAG: ribose-phosphate diphosphokinase [Pseudomonadota bacterium]